MLMIENLTEYPDERVLAALGYIPTFLSLDDKRPAKEQINEAYIGGWNKFDGFAFDARRVALVYPNDPPQRAIARIQLGDEQVIVFEHAWVMILQADGSWEVARLD